MGMGFRLNLKWVLSVKSPSLTNSVSWPSSYSFRGIDGSNDSARLSFSSVITGENEIMYNDPLRAHCCSFAAHTLSNDYSETDQIKGNARKRSCGGVYNMTNDDIQTDSGEDQLTFLTSLQASKTSHFRVLMNNLDMLERTFADSDTVRLERDILVQLERLGALNLFHAFLSRSVSPSLVDLSDASSTESIDKLQVQKHVDESTDDILVHSGKKEKRKAKRVRAWDKLSKTNHVDPQLKKSPSKRYLKDSGRKPRISRNEAEMAGGVKLLAKLEKVRKMVEEETGEAASLSRWADAAGIDKKTLQQNLQFGWYCRDELLRSTRSLIMYLAKNYRSLGVAFDDLIQAGSIGVLHGAERFDHSRGYRFSTYIQYWIRKSMLTLLERNSRGVRIPFVLSKAVDKIQKARKTLRYGTGKYPDDDEIARLTGLSLAKIASADKCLRVVGSLDDRIGDFSSPKFLELIPDTLIERPEDTVIRQHIIKDLNNLLNALEPKERQILILRFGLRNFPCKSLQEIGGLFGVSKEWIRRVERTALIKLRDEESLHNLNHYLNM